MTSAELLTLVEAEFGHRRFSAGLLIAFIDFIEALGVPAMHLSSTADFFAAFPQQTVFKGGKQVNTLIVQRHRNAEHSAVLQRCGKDVSRGAPPLRLPELRAPRDPSVARLPALARRARYVRLHNIGALKAERDRFRVETASRSGVRPSTGPPRASSFSLHPRKFRCNAARRQEEPALHFRESSTAFSRLTTHISKATHEKFASDRLVRGALATSTVWDGSSLAISAEVKQTTISSTRIADFGAFANEINRRGALGMVVVLNFSNDGVRDAIEDLGVRAFSRYDLLRIVQLWDTIKQRSAVSALMYYVEHVERNSALSSRLKGFLDEQMASR